MSFQNAPAHIGKALPLLKILAVASPRLYRILILKHYSEQRYLLKSLREILINIAFENIKLPNNNKLLEDQATALGEILNCSALDKNILLTKRNSVQKILKIALPLVKNW